MLRGFLHNVYTGRRSGRRSTGSAVRGGYTSGPGVGVRALTLRPGTRSPEALMKAVGEAFYVQSVSGLHSGTNPISGDFSVGAVGLMVRDGEFAEPVREVTIASTLQRMLLDVTEIARRPHLPARRGGGRDDAGRRDDAQRRLTERDGRTRECPRPTSPSATRVEAAGTPPKLIDEYVGRVNTGTDAAQRRAHAQPGRLVGARADARVRRVHRRARRARCSCATATASSRCAPVRR